MASPERTLRSRGRCVRGAQLWRTRRPRRRRAVRRGRAVHPLAAPRPTHGRRSDPATPARCSPFSPLCRTSSGFSQNEKLDLVIANRNAPKQTVLSGPTAEVERAEKAFAAAGIKSARLPVAAAFHSRFVADAAVPFRAALEGCSPSLRPRFRSSPTRLLRSIPPTLLQPATCSAHQLAKPVAFVEQLRAMADAGVRTFVEVGPGSVLTRLAEATLADENITGFDAFALGASGGKRSGVLDLADVLARLAAGGRRVNLHEWEQNSRCRPQLVPTTRPGLTVPLTGRITFPLALPGHQSRSTASTERLPWRTSTVRQGVGENPPLP